MKVSEKSLELNVGAEVLQLLRRKWGLRKAYLRGLTQREEHREGADFIAQLSPHTRIYAFQFKAPRGPFERQPYKFRLQRPQHEKLCGLAQGRPGGVYYVLPFYVFLPKLQAEVPDLLRDTWFLPVATMRGTDVFGQHRSKTLSCWRGIASVNPEYELLRGLDLEPDPGIPLERFLEWYAGLHDSPGVDEAVGKGKNAWLVRGMRIAIATCAGGSPRMVTVRRVEHRSERMSGPTNDRGGFAGLAGDMSSEPERER